MHRPRLSLVQPQGQTVLSQNEGESAITYPVSAAAADLSLDTVAKFFASHVAIGEK